MARRWPLFLKRDIIMYLDDSVAARGAHAARRLVHEQRRHGVLHIVERGQRLTAAIGKCNNEKRRK